MMDVMKGVDTSKPFVPSLPEPREGQRVCVVHGNIVTKDQFYRLKYMPTETLTFGRKEGFDIYRFEDGEFKRVPQR